MSKFIEPRPYADPETAARKLVEIARGITPAREGRLHIEKLNEPMLFDLKATPAEYSAGLKFAIERGWFLMHESGTYVKLLDGAPETAA
jgi:hypothetical protein